MFIYVKSWNIKKWKKFFNLNKTLMFHNFSPDSSSVDSSISYIKSGCISESTIEDKYEVKIPKIIMQTWKTKDVPDKWKVSPKSIKRMMPDWKYVLMTDEDNRKFVKKHFPDFLPYYDDFPHGIQRCDAIRYMWLFVNGGIYMDLDYEMLHPLDELFIIDSEAYLVSSSNVGAYITNSFMASKPGCKLWLEMIEAMKKPLPWYYLGKHVQVMNTAGPIQLTHVAKNSSVVYSLLPGKLLIPCSICNIGKCKSKGAYLKQLEGSSWVSYDTKFYNFFLCQYRQIITFVVFLLILILVVIFIIWSGLI